MLGHTQVTLLGTIGDKGVELRAIETTGTMMASCRLAVAEEGTNGQIYTTWIPVQAFGKARDVLHACDPGEAVLLDGKLKWHSWQDKAGNKQGSIVVVALGAKRLTGLSAQAVTHD